MRKDSCEIIDQRAVSKEFDTALMIYPNSILSRKLTRKGIMHLNQKRKRNYQVNKTQSYRKMQLLINRIFSDMQNIIETLGNYTVQLIKQAEIVRPIELEDMEEDLPILLLTNLN